MQKAYSRINWENYPSEATALNESNLNRMDYAIDVIDNRVIALDTTKLDVAVANDLVQDVTIDSATGVVSIIKKDGSVIQLPTNLNKVAINATYDRTTQSIILTYPDGTSDSISLSDFITQTEFLNSPTIAFLMSGDTVSAQVREGSIGDSHLRTNYLADIRVSEANAVASAANADAHDISSRSWAIGGTETRPGEDENNSLYFANVARGQAEIATAAMTTAQDLVDVATARLTGLYVHVDFEDGNLYYEEESGIMLRIEPTDGNLYYEVQTV